MSANVIHIPDDLLAELQKKAAAEGKSVDELAEAALRVQFVRPERVQQGHLRNSIWSSSGSSTIAMPMSVNG